MLGWAVLAVWLVGHSVRRRRLRALPAALAGHLQKKTHSRFSLEGGGRGRCGSDTTRVPLARRPLIQRTSLVKGNHIAFDSRFVVDATRSSHGWRVSRIARAHVSPTTIYGPWFAFGKATCAMACACRRCARRWKDCNSAAATRTWIKRQTNGRRKFFQANTTTKPTTTKPHRGAILPAEPMALAMNQHQPPRRSAPIRAKSLRGGARSAAKHGCWIRQPQLERSSGTGENNTCPACMLN